MFGKLATDLVPSDESVLVHFDQASLVVQNRLSLAGCAGDVVFVLEESVITVAPHVRRLEMAP